MCLIIKTKDPKDNIDNYIKIAKEDIIVYKRLSYKSYDNNIYRTPHKCYPINKDGDILTVNKFGTKRTYLKEIEVHQGIHSYTNLKRAKISSFYPEEVIVKCIIPEGTPYIESNDMFGKRNEIVSLILIIPPIDGKSLCKK